MDPASTYYTNDQPWPLRDRVLYVTYDITDQLRDGENAVGMMLGNGWYSDDGQSPGRQSYAERPRMIAQLVIDYASGRRDVVVSDGSWRSAAGPVISNEISMGEHYDARLEQPLWCSPGFDESSWQPAKVGCAPSENLEAQMVRPAGSSKRARPLRCIKSGLRPTSSILASTSAVGRRFACQKPRAASCDCGTPERSMRRGGLIRATAWQAAQTDVYEFGSDAHESWEPRFTLHGFRYVELSGLTSEPSRDAALGRHVRNDVETTGDFSCSNEIANQLQSNIRWTLASSFQGVPQDAADRAERMGWLGDTGFVVDEYFVNFDGAAFWTKWLEDIRDAQRPNGNVPVIAPLHLGRLPGNGENKAWRIAPDWTVTYPLFVWAMYWYYGDRTLVAEHYDALVQLVDYYGTLADDDILPSVLGDHMEPQSDGSPAFSRVTRHRI